MSDSPVQIGIGIDLATTFLAVSIHSGRKKLHMSWPNDGQQLPAVVYAARDGKMLFGRTALNAACRDPENLHAHFKRGIPTQPDGPWNNGPTPVELSTLLLRYVWGVIQKVRPDVKKYVPELGGAEAPGGLQIAVTHPATYRLETIRSLERAINAVGDGFKADILMPEPVAMCQVYREERSDLLQTGDLVAVFDYGGGTYDVSILELQRGVFNQVVGGKGDDCLGGLNFTGELFLRGAEKLGLPFQQAYDPLRGLVLGAIGPEHRQDAAELWEQADTAKKALSLDTETSVYVQTRSGLKELDFTRDEVQKFWEPLFVRLAEATADVVAGAPYAWKDIKHVLVGGGSALIPGVAERIAEVLGRDVSELFVYGDPAHMVADGAAYQAKVKEKASVTLSGGLGFRLSDPRNPGRYVYKFVFGTGEPVPVDGKPVECMGQYVASNGTPSTLQVTLVEAKAGVNVPRPNGKPVLLSEDEILPIASINIQIELPQGRHDVRFGFYHTPEKQLRYRLLVMDGDTDLVDGVVKKDDSSVDEVGSAFDLVLLLDGSSSMSGDKIAQARAAVRYLLTLVAPLDVRVALIPFGKKTELLCPLGTDLALIDRELDKVVAGGSTPMDRGLQIAANHVGQQKSQREVLTAIVTDGWPDDVTPAENLAELIRSLGELVTIGIGQGAAADFLTRIATSPQHYFYCDDVSALSSIFEQIVELHLDPQEASV